MGKKQKKIAKIQQFAKKEEVGSSSPFSSIVLKEKKEKEAGPSVSRSDGRKPSDIVQGYDPGASFADILESFERTGNPYSMPKKGAASKKEEKVDFARILEQWENRGKIRPDAPERKKSSYTATKSFADILSEFERGPAAKNVQVKEKDGGANGGAAKETAGAGKEPDEGLFRKPEEDEKRSPRASWSIFGDNGSFVRKEEEKDAGSGGGPSFPSSSYRPSRSFSSILSSYYGGEAADKKDRGSGAPKTFDQILKEKGDEERKGRNYTISALRAMLPQSTLDLHGMTAEEGEKAVTDFLSDARRNGLRKISIITGKGLHSGNGVPVLKEMVERVLEQSGLVSEQSRAPASHGGSGAVWIILKK